MRIISEGRVEKDGRGGYIISDFVIDCEGGDIDLSELLSYIKVKMRALDVGDEE